jgi:microcystin-dependent protein
MTTYNNITGMAQDLEGFVRRNMTLFSHILHYSQATIGDYKVSARDEDYLGWLICDGRLIQRSEYPALFEVIGTSFGNTTSSNFRLPDLRGRVLGMIGNGSGLTSRALGDAVGEEAHVLTIPEMPSHNHGGATSSDGAHSHTTNATGDTVGLAFKNGQATPSGLDNDGDELNLSTTGALTINSAGAHAHTINAQGGGNAHNNMQPTTFVGNAFIFAGLLAGAAE